MQLLKQFWLLAKPYWINRAHWFTWVLLALSIGALLSVVEASVWLNTWNKEFYDALVDLEFDKIQPLMFEFCVIIAIIVVLMVYGQWLQQLVIIRWRTWFTEQLISQWMTDKTYYRMTLGDEPDNPDQRIAEDARLLTSDTISLFVGGIQAVAVLFAFTRILWDLSGQLSFEWNNETFQIAGYLFWVALVYSIVGTLVTHYFGHPLHKLNFAQQRKEADFRARLLRRRDSAEQIALLKGEATEQRQLKNSFQFIASNWYSLMNREKKLGLVVNSYHRVAMMVPLFAGIPALMAKSITIGGLFQVRMAFMKVYAGFSWFVHNYAKLTSWSATVERLGTFTDAMQQQHQAQNIDCQTSMQWRELTVQRPDGKPLLEGMNIELNAGSHLLVSGASGLGKSTLLRTIAGIWPFYEGQIFQQQGETMLLPQRPYLPSGTLHDCLNYPATQTVSNEQLQQVLQLVGLDELAKDVEQTGEWQQVLSGGEQQKFSLARALLAQPDTLILDEATSSLDEATAIALIELIKQQLPQTTLMMVSHQAVLKPLFERHLDLMPYGAAKA
ncbi:ABC transporter ATP-binding protein/permease [Shewanella intestini]|uniref:ABC transporter ATP-binding protein/permease n=1 Tax=Shewanella intestini TaxID=2017544 RepID=A0ABS5I037_9GAMM|nr:MULTISPECIES: ABC transporter ATP-binding protein/permease [Shewanella]MBR9727391.1 ABC transporter ATP-binding protein/permease [Shewanella intestini]